MHNARARGGLRCAYCVAAEADWAGVASYARRAHCNAMLLCTNALHSILSQMRVCADAVATGAARCVYQTCLCATPPSYLKGLVARQPENGTRTTLDTSDHVPRPQQGKTKKNCSRVPSPCASKTWPTCWKSALWARASGTAATAKSASQMTTPSPPGKPPPRAAPEAVAAAAREHPTAAAAEAVDASPAAEAAAAGSGGPRRLD
jgi:hypothetical protein